MQQENRKIHTFFLEFIIVTILFVLTTSVLVVAFVKANRLSEQSEEALFAMQQSISLLESKKELISYEEATHHYVYDEAWRPVTEGGCYHIIIEESLITKPHGMMKELALRSYRIKDDQTLFETVMTTYQPDFVREQEEVSHDAD